MCAKLPRAKYKGIRAVVEATTSTGTNTHNTIPASTARGNDHGLNPTEDQIQGAKKDTSGLGLASDDLRTQLEAKLAAQPGNHLLIMLSGRLNDAERQMALGILDAADYQRERNRIRAALLQA